LQAFWDLFHRHREKKKHSLGNQAFAMFYESQLAFLLTIRFPAMPLKGVSP